MTAGSSGVRSTPASLLRWTLVATVLLCVGPIFVDLWTGDEARPFGFLVADYFYYFTVARNFVEHGLLSFDQMTTTNGFHPLWQAMLIVMYWIAAAFEVGDVAFFKSVVFINAALVAVGLVFIGLAWRSVEGRLPTLFPLVCPSAFGLLTVAFYDRTSDYGPFQSEEGQRPVVGTVWHYANGMETGLLVAFFGLMLWYFVKRPLPVTRRHAIVCGCLAAAVTLSRLDHIFFAGALLIAWVVAAVAKRDWSTLRLILVAWGVFAAIVGTYLVFNKATANAWLPLSGTVKSTYPFVHADGIKQAITVLRFRSGTPIHMVYRQAQVLLPVVFALAYVVRCFGAKLDEDGLRFHWRNNVPKLDVVMVALVPAIISLSAYNFFFVRPYDQGTWYFPLSTVFMSLCVVRWGDQLLSRFADRAWTPLAALAASSVLGVWFYFPSTHHTDFHRDVAEFYLEEAPAIEEFYAEQNIEPSIIEYYDGVFAAATGMPTFSGFGLVVDKEAARAKRRGEIFKVAYERGFDRIHSFYIDGLKLSTAPNTKELTRVLARWIDKSQLENFDLRVEYMSKSGKYVVIKAERKPKKKKKKKGKAKRGRRNKKGRGSARQGTSEATAPDRGSDRVSRPDG